MNKDDLVCEYCSNKHCKSNKYRIFITVKFWRWHMPHGYMYFIAPINNAKSEIFLVIEIEPEILSFGNNLSKMPGAVAPLNTKSKMIRM